MITPPATPHYDHTLILLDTSASIDQTQTCSSLLGMVEQRMDKELAPKSRLLVWVTGNESTRYESIPIFDKPFPATRSLIEGGGQEAAMAGRKAFLVDLLTACRQAPPSDKTALYLAAKRMIHQAKEGLHCGPKDGCLIMLRSDGLEEREEGLKTAIDSGQLPEEGSVPQIDSSDVEILFCGHGEVTSKGPIPGKGRSRRNDNHIHEADIVPTVWGSIFTGEEVTFLSVCPRSTLLAAQ